MFKTLLTWLTFEPHWVRGGSLTLYPPQTGKNYCRRLYPETRAKCPFGEEFRSSLLLFLHSAVDLMLCSSDLQGRKLTVWGGGGGAGGHDRENEERWSRLNNGLWGLKQSGKLGCGSFMERRPSSHPTPSSRSCPE